MFIAPLFPRHSLTSAKAKDEKRQADLWIHFKNLAHKSTDATFLNNKMEKSLSKLKAVSY